MSHGAAHRSNTIYLIATQATNTWTTALKHLKKAQKAPERPLQTCSGGRIPRSQQRSSDGSLGLCGLHRDMLAGQINRDACLRVDGGERFGDSTNAMAAAHGGDGEFHGKTLGE